jgi:hypothetical protein
MQFVLPAGANGGPLDSAGRIDVDVALVLNL